MVMNKLACFLFVLVTFIAIGNIAHATHDPGGSAYQVKGFLADGRHVLFEKSIWDGDVCAEEWVAIYELSTQKRVASRAVFRAEDCNKPISKRQGKKILEKLLHPFGGLAKSSSWKKTKNNHFALHQHQIVFESIGKYPKEDTYDSWEQRAYLRFKLTLRRGGITNVLLDKPTRVSPVADPGGGDIAVWDEVELSQVVESSVAPVFLAVVIHNRPKILVVPIPLP